MARLAEFGRCGSFCGPHLFYFFAQSEGGIRGVLGLIGKAFLFPKIRQKAVSKTIESAEAWEKDGKITVSVNDTGCGINEGDLAKVKTKFYKANHTRRGSGIGLAVADEIVAMHGGKLDIYSAGEGKGTTVTITLPPK